MDTLLKNRKSGRDIAIDMLLISFKIVNMSLFQMSKLSRINLKFCDWRIFYCIYFFRNLYGDKLSQLLFSIVDTFDNRVLYQVFYDLILLFNFLQHALLFQLNVFSYYSVLGDELLLRFNKNPKQTTEKYGIN